MKLNAVFLSLIISLISTGLSAQPVFKNNELTITRLETNMWVVETSDMTTMYLVEGQDKALLIDTGTKCASLDSVIRLITTKPLLVLITHWHPDHAGNVRYFSQIYMHPADTALFGRKMGLYSGKVNFVQDGYKFDLGGTMLEVKHTPGHTPGSVVLLDKASGSAYTGDAFGSGQVWMQLEPHVSMEIYAASCKKMLTWMDQGITKIYCGHYPYVKKPFDKGYMTDMTQLAEALSKGTAPAGKSYEIKVPIGAKNPMITKIGIASIVYNPDKIN